MNFKSDDFKVINFDTVPFVQLFLHEVNYNLFIFFRWIVLTMLESFVVDILTL